MNVKKTIIACLVSFAFGIALSGAGFYYFIQKPTIRELDKYKERFAIVSGELKDATEHSNRLESENRELIETNRSLETGLSNASRIIRETNARVIELESGFNESGDRLESAISIVSNLISEISNSGTTE